MALRSLFASNVRRQCGHRAAPGVRLHVDRLEERTVPYGTTGNVWPHPELVTLSFMPDGTNLGGPASDLFAEFNAAFGSSNAWQNVLLKATQAWAQQTNLNFAVVADSGMTSGGGSYQQGDPAVGDIRFGGFNFDNSGLLALAYMPPEVNNYSIAGDIGINTAQIFNINGGDYDLYTVMTHEIGHALGLDHSHAAAAIMYSAYEGSMPGVTSDDIAGIRSIYGGPRLPDAFDAAGPNSSFAASSDLSPSIKGRPSATIGGLDITSTSDVDYYRFTVPYASSGTMTLTVQSQGLSLLAPSFRVYNSNQTQIAAATGSGYRGSTVSATFDVVPGQKYFVRVAGANASAFGTGAYALSVNFNGGSTETTASPDTSTPNGNPLNGGGGIANRRDANGVSVSSLLIGLDRSAYRLLGGGLLGNLIDSVVSTAIQLPFVDAMETRVSPRGVGVFVAPNTAFIALPAVFVGATPVLSPGPVATIALSTSETARPDTSYRFPVAIGTLENAMHDRLTVMPLPSSEELTPIVTSTAGALAKSNEPTYVGAALTTPDVVESHGSSARIDEDDCPSRRAVPFFLPAFAFAFGLNPPPVNRSDRRATEIRR